eukprot:8933100-Ditylum_brightwellii.AAC.1
MKAVRESIKDYDKACTRAIPILEQRFHNTSAAAASAASNNEEALGDVAAANNSNSNITCKVGDHAIKFFLGHGKFEGT